MKYLSSFVIFLTLFLFGSFSNKLTNTQKKENKPIEIRGIYGSPDPFWKNNLNLSDLGINAIFVHNSSLTNEMIRRAREEGLKIFAEFPTLNGKNYVEQHQEAWPINEKGERVKSASWFMGVCPTEPGFRKYRMDQLRNLLKNLDIDGVWMDYVHWHAQFEEPEPILPETCFCENCLKKFQEDSGIDLPEGLIPEKAKWILDNCDSEWRNWRCNILAGWAKDFKTVINQEKPGTLLGLYHCPWNNKEFNGARRRILGIDYELLKEYIDVFSPMVYHGRMERKPEWVKENIEWFSNELKIKYNSFPKIWPIVQAHNNDPEKITPKEFENVLHFGMSGMATGIMMFTSYAVAEDPEKTRKMKKVYTGLSDKN